MYNDVAKTKPNDSTEFFFHCSTSFNSRQTDRQMSALILLKLSYFGKQNSWKKFCKFYGQPYQEIDSQFINPETLIPTLKFVTNGLLSEGFQEIQIL